MHIRKPELDTLGARRAFVAFLPRGRVGDERVAKLRHGRWDQRLAHTATAATSLNDKDAMDEHCRWRAKRYLANQEPNERPPIDAVVP